MNGIKIVGIVLVLLGVLALAYGQFTYTEDSHDAKVGPVELTVKDKETVNVPAWAGVAAILVGGILLVVRTRS
jgi:uncharacterized membrane protein